MHVQSVQAHNMHANSHNACVGASAQLILMTPHHKAALGQEALVVGHHWMKGGGGSQRVPCIGLIYSALMRAGAPSQFALVW